MVEESEEAVTAEIELNWGLHKMYLQKINKHFEFS